MFHETDRIVLREWKESDIPIFASMNQDPKIMEYFPELLNEKQSLESVKNIKNHFNEYGFGLFAVELKELTQFIGFIGLKVVDFEADFCPAIEIGWRLNNTYWGKGLAVEGASKILDFAFKELYLPRIVSFTAKENYKSIRVMEKLGMKYQYDFYHPKLKKDHPLCKHVLYQINIDEWK